MPAVALVTGITGQDGYFLADRLIARGHTVHGLVRPGDPETINPAVQVHEADLADGARLEFLVRELRPNAVYNLGGLSSVAQSWQEPVLTAKITGLAVAHLLEAAYQLHSAGHPVRFLQASSAEIFGVSDDVPQTEATSVRPVNPYGSAKAAAQHLVSVYRSRGFFASSVILYGHESPRRRPTFVARKITAGVAAIVRGETDELVLGNLGATRDWGWAPDFVEAMELALGNADPDDYVVSTGEAHTVEEFAATAFQAAGLNDWRAFVRSDPALTRIGDGAVQIGDSTKLRQRTGWRPTKLFDEVVVTMVRADLAQEETRSVLLGGDRGN